MMPALPPDQMNEVLRWLVLLWLAGMALRPLTLRLIPDQPEGQVALAKLMAWLIAGFAAWLAAALGAAPFAPAGPMVAALVLGAIYALTRAGAPAPDWRRLLRAEVLFLALFTLGLGQRLAQPDLSTLEKFTDLGFLASAMRSGAMPAPDVWFAGQAVNYYSFGQTVAALWSLAAGLPADHGYQLAMATLFALTGSLTAHLIATLLTRDTPRAAALLALIGTALVLYAGNGHSVLYDLLRPWSPSTLPQFNFPDSTRFIGYDPDRPDKAFTEFPAYGFYVGDLHAHLAATPVWLGFLCLVLSILRRGWTSARHVPLSAAALAGGILGLLFMSNTWDVAICGLTAAMAFATLFLRRTEGFAHRLDHLAATALIAVAAFIATVLPFSQSFTPFSNGFGPAPAHTPLWQLAVVYWPVLPGLAALAALPRQPIEADRAFLFLLAATAVLLVLLPELVILRDIYGRDYARANTMFKLTFRAQPLLQITAILAAGGLLARCRRALALAVLIPVLLPLCYMRHSFAFRAWDASLDGTRFLGAERALIDRLGRLPLNRGEAIVEAGSDAFTAGGRASAVTGMPTVIGWLGHEWLWRNDYLPAQTRRAEVDRFYTTAPKAERCAFIARHRLRYIVIGLEEWNTYPLLDLDGLRALGGVVYHEPARAEGPELAILAVSPESCAP